MQATIEWAEQTQALSPEPIGLADSAAAVIKAGDLARNTSRELETPFGTEPSAFIKLLNELAPDHGR